MRKARHNNDDDDDDCDMDDLIINCLSDRANHDTTMDGMDIQR